MLQRLSIIFLKSWTWETEERKILDFPGQTQDGVNVAKFDKADTIFLVAVLEKLLRDKASSVTLLGNEVGDGFKLVEIRSSARGMMISV